MNDDETWARSWRQNARLVAIGHAMRDAFGFLPEGGELTIRKERGKARCEGQAEVQLIAHLINEANQ